MAQIGGEFGIGELLNSTPDDVQNVIYDRWKSLSPYLVTAISDLEMSLPILQAAVIAKAPQHIIS